MDPTKVKVHVSYPHSGTFYSLVGDLSAGKLYAGSDDYTICVYDLSADKKEPVARWKQHDNYVSALALLRRPGKTYVISGSYDRHLIWWDAATGKSVRRVEGHALWVRDLAVTPDGTRLVSVGDDMLVKIWDADTGKLIQALEGHAPRTPQGHVTALYVVAISPDGQYIASADRIGDVLIWQLSTGKLVHRFQVPTLYTYDPRQRKRSIGGIRSLAFSLDGKHLAVGGIGQINNVDGLAGPVHVEVWDWRKPEKRFVAGAEGHQGMVNHLLYHPNEPWLIGAGGGSGNGFVALWKLEADGTKLAATHRIKGDGHIHRLCFNAKATQLYAAGFHKLDVWGLG
jgi:WD40 repeat protein